MSDGSTSRTPDRLRARPPGRTSRSRTEYVGQIIVLIQPRSIDGGHALRRRRATSTSACARCRELRRALAPRRRPDGPGRGRRGRRAARRTRSTSRCGRRSKAGEDTALGRALGPGRPGWHIECSAMAEGLLGVELRHPRRRHRPRVPAPRERGGPDRCAARRRRWPAIWMHNGMLAAAAGEKMAKSRGQHRAGSARCWTRSAARSCCCSSAAATTASRSHVLATRRSRAAAGRACARIREAGRRLVPGPVAGMRWRPHRDAFLDRAAPTTSTPPRALAALYELDPRGQPAAAGGRRRPPARDAGRARARGAAGRGRRRAGRPRRRWRWLEARRGRARGAATWPEADRAARRAGAPRGWRSATAAGMVGRRARAAGGGPVARAASATGSPGGARLGAPVPAARQVAAAGGAAVVPGGAVARGARRRRARAVAGGAAVARARPGRAEGGRRVAVGRGGRARRGGGGARGARGGARGGAGRGAAGGGGGAARGGGGGGGGGRVARGAVGARGGGRAAGVRPRGGGRSRRARAGPAVAPPAPGARGRGPGAPGGRSVAAAGPLRPQPCPRGAAGRGAGGCIGGLGDGGAGRGGAGCRDPVTRAERDGRRSRRCRAAATHQGVRGGRTPTRTPTPERAAGAPEGAAARRARRGPGSARTVGAICRTAECAGATGVTHCPERRAAQVTAGGREGVGRRGGAPADRASCATSPTSLGEARQGRRRCWVYGAAGRARRTCGLRPARLRGGVSSLVLGAGGTGLRPRVASTATTSCRLPLRGRGRPRST